MDFMEMFKNLGGLKSQMEAIQNRMKQLSISGESGAGMVKVVFNGEGNATNITVDETLLSKENREMLEELLLSAINDGIKKTREAVAHEMKSATGLNLPGIDKLFGG